jgi:hypothetical protein
LRFLRSFADNDSFQVNRIYQHSVRPSRRNPVDQGQNFRVEEGLGDEALDQAALQGLVDGWVIGKEKAGNQNDEWVSQEVTQVLDEHQAGHVRELCIHEDRAVGGLAAQVDRLLRAQCVMDREAPAGDQASQYPVDVRLIIDGEKGRCRRRTLGSHRGGGVIGITHYANGKWTRKRVPMPGALSTSMRP